MAEPGDPKAPDPTAPPASDGTPEIPPHHDLDEAVGFASSAALAGRPRPAGPPPVETPPPAPEPEPLMVAPTPDPEPEPVVVPPVSAPPPPPEPVVAPRSIRPSAEPEPVPEWARETPIPARPRGAPRDQPVDVQGSMSLYAVYALILFAVPTLGVSAAIALLAVTGRPGPTGAVGSSHFIYQQRTLWVGAVVALLGAILIAVGLGVFVLFVLALWLILRGASGVLKLKAGRPIANPRALLF